MAVTGASGFIGRRLVPALALEGHEVISLARKRGGPPLGRLGRSLELDGSPIQPSVFESADALIHLAAFIPPSQSDPAFARACFETNALGTLALMQAAAEAKISQVVHLSTGNIYRSSLLAVDEESAIYPSSRAAFYLASKICGEIYATEVGQRTSTPLVILRPSSVYGPGMNGGLVATLCRRMLRGQDVVLRDGGCYAADLVHVDDVVGAICRSLGPSIGGTINLGCGRTYTTKEVATILATLLEFPTSRITLDPVESSPRDLGFSPLDIGRARRLLGFDPRQLREGLGAYVESARQELLS